jgi:hypothetical protein
VIRLVAVHTCPLWEDLDTGQRRAALSPDDVPARGRVVGWVNALEVRIASETRFLLHGGVV